MVMGSETDLDAEKAESRMERAGCREQNDRTHKTYLRQSRVGSQSHQIHPRIVDSAGRSQRNRRRQKTSCFCYRELDVKMVWVDSRRSRGQGVARPTRWERSKPVVFVSTIKDDALIFADLGNDARTEIQSTARVL